MEVGKIVLIDFGGFRRNGYLYMAQRCLTLLCPCLIYQDILKHDAGVKEIDAETLQTFR